MVLQSPSELNEQFREQCLALRASCDSFDKGNLWEAKRLSAAIYVLCHDPPTERKGSRTVSLLKQLDLKRALRFLSTTYSPPGHLLIYAPLLKIVSHSTEPFHYGAKLADGSENWNWLSFNDWWNETIFIANYRRSLSRKNLIFAMRSQDGGAHVDEAIRDLEYLNLKLGNSPFLTRSKAGVAGPPSIKLRVNLKGKPISDAVDEEFEPVPDGHLFTVRQIAFELLSSIGTLLPN